MSSDELTGPCRSFGSRGVPCKPGQSVVFGHGGPPVYKDVDPEEYERRMAPFRQAEADRAYWKALDWSKMAPGLDRLKLLVGGEPEGKGPYGGHSICAPDGLGHELHFVFTPREIRVRIYTGDPRFDHTVDADFTFDRLWNCTSASQEEAERFAREDTLVDLSVRCAVARKNGEPRPRGPRQLKREEERKAKNLADRYEGICYKDGSAQFYPEIQEAYESIRMDFPTGTCFLHPGIGWTWVSYKSVRPMGPSRSRGRGIAASRC